MTAPNIEQTATGEVLSEWIDPHLPGVFSRWHAHIEEFQRATTAAIISAAGVEPGHRVLDVGCGSGIPSLALAGVVGPTGHVVATDPSPVFIEAAAENAKRCGLNNIEFVQTTAAALPFETASFDAVTCHMAVMFFPDVDAGLRRIREMLRPGCRAAFVAWGPPPANEYFDTFWRTAAPYLPPEAMQEPPPDTPAPMRFARAGSLSNALQSATFAGVREVMIPVELIWPGRADRLRDFWFELTRLDEKVAEEQRAAFRDDVQRAFERFERDGSMHFRADIVLATGQA